MVIYFQFDGDCNTKAITEGRNSGELERERFILFKKTFFKYFAALQELSVVIEPRAQFVWICRLEALLK